METEEVIESGDTQADDTATELDALRQELASSREGERAAIERLRAALLASEPALDPEMVGGETLAEVEGNFAAATALISKIRERAALESASRLAPGAGGRLSSRPRTAFEKIRDGLGRTA